MKTALKILAIGLVSVAAARAETNQTDVVRKQTGITRPKPEVFLVSPSTAPNRIVKKKVSYSGILVQMAHTSNPLQLINPFAPAEYGNGYRNLSLHPITGKAEGLALLSVEF